MISRIYLAISVLLFALSANTYAAWVYDSDQVDGVELGQTVILRPQVEVLGGYDNRVKLTAAGEAEGDFYSDVAAGLELLNHPSVYNWLVKGRYGYRFYASESDLNNDFYTATGRIGTQQAPFIWNASADLTKALDYSTQYNADSGEGPDSILTYLANTRFLTKVDTSYDKKWFEKTSLVPGYNFSYYHQEYDGLDDANEWVIHQAYLLLRHQYSSKTSIGIGADASLQMRKEENGTIGTLLASIEHRMTKKTSFAAEFGYALANYDLSGEDQGFVSRLRGNWRYTNKVDFYVFGGNQFQPGYSGGAARMVYRLGYGGRWKVVPKFSLRGSVLHDYQEQIGDKTSTSSYYGTVRHFIDLKADYRPVDPLSLIAGIQYIKDERPESQTKVYLSAIYRFY